MSDWIPLWLHKLGSPPTFYRFAGALQPWAMALALLRAGEAVERRRRAEDRKSTRLNSSHPSISYAVFCLKKKKKKKTHTQKEKKSPNKSSKTIHQHDLYCFIITIFSVPHTGLRRHHRFLHLLHYFSNSCH